MYIKVYGHLLPFFSVIIKLVYLVIFINLIFHILFVFKIFISDFFTFISIGSIVLGTLGTIYQEHLKRFILYSSITQMGFIFAGLSNFTFNSLVYTYLFLFIYIIYSIYIYVYWFANKS
jgi:NADH:ubiquinone oxidoreductase subunit 2 (subunit N)